MGTQTLADDLEAAYAEEEQLTIEGADTENVRARILELRRRIRAGGRLRAGDFLLDGQYKLVKEVGHGGFATVYQAFDKKRRCLVAIKVLHGQHADDKSRRERFFRGARKMAELSHSGIVRVLDSEQIDEGHHFFVMEYVTGGDLREAVLDGQLDSEHALDLILSVGDGLAYAHERGIIHRDIKPANILLDEDHRPELTDFDVVRAGDTTGGTRTGALGSFGYAAPEAMQRPQEADARADVYGLGMTAIFALHGADPHPIDIWRDPAGFIATLDIPDAVQPILQKAIAWDMDERFASVRAFCEALKAARDSNASRLSQEDERREPPPAEKLSQKASPGVIQAARPTAFRDVFNDASGEGPAMIWLPGGTFQMGSSEGVGRDDEHPAHEVTLSHYAVGEHPVTVGEFRRFVDATGYQTEAEEGDGAWVWHQGKAEQKHDASWRNPYLTQDDRHPVVCISWNDAKAYCAWLAKQTGQTYGLLTEAQWEYACRAGSDAAYGFGDDESRLDDYA